MKSLSLAGQITLASSILNNIPIFQMQTTSLLDYVVRDIEKYMRWCILAEEEGNKMIHLVN